MPTGTSLEPDQDERRDAVDPVQEHYDRKFDEITQHYNDETAGEPKHSKSSSPDDLRQAEESGRTAEEPVTSEENKLLDKLDPGGFYRPETSKDAKGALKNIIERDAKDIKKAQSKSKKYLVAGGITGSILMVLVIALALIALVGPYKQVHFATVMRSAAFARYTLYTKSLYAQTIFDAATLTESSTGHAYMSKPGIVSRTLGINPDKSLKVLGREGTLKFEFDQGRKWGGVKRTNTLRAVVVDGARYTLDDYARTVAPGKTYNQLTQKQKWLAESRFTAAIKDALESRLSNTSRSFRRSTFKGIRLQTGITMSKWLNKAKEYKGKSSQEARKLNVDELFERLSKGGTVGGGTLISTEAEEAAKEQKATALKQAETGVAQSPGKVRAKLAARADTVGKASAAVFLTTVACVAVDLDNSIKAAQKENEARAYGLGHDALTAMDQTILGETTGEAVGGDASRYDGVKGQPNAENAIWYKQNSGQTIPESSVATQAPDIPMLKPSAKFAATMDMTHQFIRNAIGPSWVLLAQLAPDAASATEGAFCSVVLNEYVQYGVAIGEIVFAIATIGQGEGVLQGIKVALTGGLKLAAGMGVADLIGHMIDNQIKNISGTAYSGLETGSSLYNDSYVGMSLLVNSGGNHGMVYGAPMTPAEGTASQQVAMDDLRAENAKSSLYNRYFAVANPFSLLGSVVAYVPNSATTAALSLRSALGNIATILTAPLHVVSSLLANFGMHKTLAAASDAQLSVQDVGVDEWGYTNPEMQMIRNDDSFRTEELAAYIEPRYDQLMEKYGECYPEQGALQSQVPEKCFAKVRKTGSECVLADNATPGKTPSSCDLGFLRTLEALHWRWYMGLGVAADNTSKTPTPQDP